MAADVFEQFASETVYSQETVDAYHRQGYWCDMSCGDYLDRHADEHGDSVAVIDDSTQISWAGLRSRADAVAAGLCQRGIESGDRVAFRLPNTIEWFVVRYAIARAGGMSVPIYPRFGTQEVIDVVRYIEPTVYIGSGEAGDGSPLEAVMDRRDGIDSLDHVFATDGPPDGAEPLRALTGDASSFTPRRIDPDYPDALALSSGTTGMPKIYYIVQNSFLNTGRDLTGRFSLSHHDTVMAFAPVQQALGTIISVYIALASGAAVSVTTSNDPEDHWRRIADDEPTYIMSLPTVTTKLMNATVADEYHLDSVRGLVNGGGPLPTDVARTAEEKGATVINAYGAGDGAWATTARPLDPQEHRVETVGPAHQSMDVRVIDEAGAPVDTGEVGEVIMHGGSCNFGYFRDEERTRATFDVGGSWEGWFHTNDAGFIDDRGNLTVVGRIDDMIIRGGQNVYPAEVEDVLLEHPSIVEAAVIGYPDDELGERIGAYVVEAADASVTLDAVVDWFDDKGLATFKWPERLETVDALPKSPGGKIKKSELEAAIEDTLDRGE
jgi:acyl-CoA synthetase